MDAPLTKGQLAWVCKLQTPHPGSIVLFQSRSLNPNAVRPMRVVGRVVAGPGDKLFVGREGLYVNGRELSKGNPLPECYQIHIPRTGVQIPLDAINLIAYRAAISSELGQRGTFLDGKLYIDGQQVPAYTFRKSYYWVLADKPDSGPDSRHIGIIPAEDILGVLLWPLTD